MAIPLREPGSDDGEESPRRFDAPPLSEFMDIECPQLAWLVGGLMPAGSLTVMVSPPNAGKTLLAFDWAAQVAATGRKVLVVEEEGGMRSCQERLRRAAEAADLVNGKMDNVLVAWNSGLSLLEPKDVTMLINYIRANHVELVVLDSISALTRGLDENDSKDMTILAEMLHAIKAETGCAVLALHHTTKESWKPGQTPSLASSRGHGALAARVDSMLALVPLAQQSGTVKLELHNIKQRDAERAQPREVEIQMTGTAAIVSSVEMNPYLDRATIEESVAKVRAILPLMLKHIPEVGTIGIGHIELFRKVGKRDEISRRALQMLVDDQSVIETISGKLVKRKPGGNA